MSTPPPCEAPLTPPETPRRFGSRLIIKSQEHEGQHLAENLELDRAWQELERTLFAMFLPGLARRILEEVPDLRTLDSSRVLNRSFYMAYRSNPLFLIRRALQKMCPPAWELREMGLPWARPCTVEYFRCLKMKEQPAPTITVANYMSHYAYESMVVARIIGAIFTTEQHAYLCHHESLLEAVHDACMRIWTFCRIFGCGKGREGDWEGQQEWLCGGAQVRQPSGPSVVGWSRNSEVLDLAPDSFGRGNGGGLSSYDIKMMLLVWDRLTRRLRSKIQSYPWTYPSRESEEEAVDRSSTRAIADETTPSPSVDEWIGSVMVLGLAAVDYLLSSADPIREADRLGWTVGPTTTTTRAEEGGFLRDACVRRVRQLTS